MGHQELIIIVYSTVINYPARPRLKRIDLRGCVRSAAAKDGLYVGSLLIILALRL